MKKSILVLMVILVFAFSSTALAIDGQKNSASNNIDGSGIFLLAKGNNRIIGLLSPDEDVDVLKMQFPNNPQKYPGGMLRDGIHRVKAYTHVRLDENYKIIRGGATLACSLEIIDEFMLREALGLNNEDVITANMVVDGTIYSPDLTSEEPVATHMFMDSRSGRVHVATLKFAKSVTLPVYSTDWDSDGELELGFAPNIYIPKSNGSNGGNSGGNNGGDDGGNDDGNNGGDDGGNDDGDNGGSAEPDPWLRPRNESTTTSSSSSDSSSSSSGEPNPTLRGR